MYLGCMVTGPNPTYHCPMTDSNSMPDLLSKLTDCLAPLGLGAAVPHIEPLIQPGVRVARSRLPTTRWPELFQSISAQVRAHHEKQGSGGHVVKRKPIMEREQMVVPQGPLKLTKGMVYFDIGEYLTREVLPESLLPLGTSRLGGQPDLPVGYTWPTWDNPGKYGRIAGQGVPLSFLGQLNLSELQAQVPTPDLPARGLLLFFFDMENEPWGFDPSDQAAHRVIFVPQGQTLQRQLCPDVEGCLIPAAVTFEPVLTFPNLDETTIDWADVGVDAQSIDWYEVGEAVRPLRPDRPHHHLLGMACQVQQGSMAAECQLVSQGFNVGEDDGWAQGMAAPGVAQGIADWRLLLQFDSEDTDDGLGAMWGDCGLLFFWIEQQKLAQHDFTDTCVILQCS